MVGTAPLNPEVIRLFRERLGLGIGDGYGQTETGPVTGMHPDEDDPARDGSMGRALPGIDARVVEERRVEVSIPPGIHDGQRIRLSGEGHAGATAGARAGDMYVEVHVRHDPRFVREGNDIFSTVDLTITQAALGATVTVPTLDGDLELDFEPGTQPGEIRVLRGKGMPVLQGFGRGDQRVLVNVVVPRRLSDEQRRLLAEFDAHVDDETYKPDEGLFEKIKSAFR